MKEDRSFSRNRTVLRDKLRKKIVLPLFLLQMLCSFTQVSYAQEVQLNLKLENSTLLDALKKIGKTIFGAFVDTFEKDRNSHRNGIFL